MKLAKFYVLLACTGAALSLASCSRQQESQQAFTATAPAEPVPAQKKPVKKKIVAAKVAKAPVVQVAEAKPVKKPVVQVADAKPVQKPAVQVAVAKKKPVLEVQETELALATPQEPSSQDQQIPADVQAMAKRLATELSSSCPLAELNDQAALDSCRKALYGPSVFRASLSPVTIWGRHNVKKPDALLKDTNLTQFRADVLSGMYMPLFMFTGKHNVTYVEREKLYRIELASTFRKRLPPGQFPYPFWHSDEKWETYQKSNAIFFWVDPQRLKITHAQFTPFGTLTPKTNVADIKYEFDGKWMWTDENGVEQPKVTLFDGLMSADNPYIHKLDESYKELALTLRDGQCFACHEPSNAYGMKQLVLLQTPAHAAGEIDRVIQSVESDRMPRSEYTGQPQPLEAAKKQALLDKAQAFSTLLRYAKKWERENNQLTQQ